MKRHVIFAGLLLALVGGAVSNTEAYLKLGFLTTTNGVVGIRWTRPIQYLVTNRDVSGVTAPQLQQAVTRAFSAWADVPGVALTHSFTGFTGAEPFVNDGMNVVGFRARPELERTLAAATFEVDESTGQILESDIFFNTAFAWSVATAGQADRYDLESVGVHEVGHLLGLGHSALGETEIQPSGGRRVLGKRAVMFPIAFPPGKTEDRTLETDDRAGIIDIYGGSSAATGTGSISGRVTMNGTGLFGAHVSAFHTSTGQLVGGFSLNTNGDFAISGLAPGLYVVRVEPLDDADLTSFFDEDRMVNIDFKPTYHSKLVAVPRGGSGPRLDVKVVAK
jgi:hypothetical protein